MANPEHLEILKQGVEVWNKWRDENPEIFPDLSMLDLRNMDISFANLRHADLTHADLEHANLRHADLSHSEISYAYLINADLNNATLSYVSFISADLKGATFNNAWLMKTTFSDIDLSEVVGLDAVKHVGASEVGISTIYESQGKIPEIFLRGCGVPESFIVQIPSLIAAMKPIQFYSCFISYSSKDQDFADRLYADLQNNGVRCWFAPEDLKIGDRIRDRIDESIRLRDKLLLILSEYSIASDWVEHEVESALEEERQRGRTILFPIRLDDAVMESSKAWAALIRRTRHIGDFREWKNHDSYQKAFDRLLRDLKAEDKTATS